MKPKTGGWILLSAATIPALAQNPQAARPAPGEFNVVFIISDQHKAAATGCYGDSTVLTPNLDHLAATGVRFTHIYTPSPLSAPARAALMTGTYPSTNGALFHRQPVRKPDGRIVKTEAGKVRDGYAEGMTTWGEWMHASGYATAAIGKMHVHGELQRGVDPDYPEGNLMGFDESDMRFYTYFPGGHYRDWKQNPDYYARYREIGEYQPYFRGNRYNQQLKPTLVQHEEDIMDYIVAQKCGDYIRRHTDRPFFLYAGLEKPHKPWTTLPRLYALYDTARIRIPATQRDWQENGRYPYVRRGNHCELTDPAEIKRSMLAYYACVTEVDEAVGRIVEATKKAGVYDRTIFVYTTDHGEQLYEHGLHEKHNMFEDAVNVPFIISCPALLPQGVVCDVVGSLVDVMPTLADLLDLAPDPQWEGQSLLPEIGAETPRERVVYSEFHEGDFMPWPKRNTPLKMRRDNRFKYVYTHGMIDQLYDATGGDPDEMHNLALDTRYADTVARFRMLTLCGWELPYIGQMKGSATRRGDRTHLTWQAVKQADKYIVWGATEPDPAKSRRLGETDGTSFTTRGAERYFWVTASWKLTQYGERSREIPMIAESYPEVLPVTPMLTAK